MGVILSSANYPADFAELSAVREAVFMREQQISREVEFDGLDADALHVAARDDATNQVIGTGRLLGQQIGRLAVLPEWRGQGVGSALLVFLLDLARQQGLAQVSLSAQMAALGFYEKFGFTADGEPFDEGRIPHRTMRLALEREEPGIGAATSRISPTALDGMHAVATASLQLVAMARRELCIYSRDLELGLYGQKDMLTALKRFALQSRYAGAIKVLLHDPRAAQSQGHPLLDLGQRLPSFILFRTPVEEEDLQYPSAFLANDRDGYLFRLLGSRYEADWSPNLAARNRQLCETFDKVWQRSRPCTEFRALGL